jgi:predicted P-loop ATPase
MESVMPDNVAETPVDLKPPTGVTGPLDQPITVTFFPNKLAQEKWQHQISLRKLADMICETSGKTKEKLPSLKLARFGDNKTDKGCLRHDANVAAISGVEVDYDGEAISLERAADDLQKSGVTALVYTSPSHTPEKPRWRVICPTSEELHPSQRHQLVSRLNGVLVGGGVLDPGSWGLSKDYYFGSVENNPPCEVVLVEGAFIDVRGDLDEFAIDKPNSDTQFTPTGKPPVIGSPQYGIKVLQDECERVADAEPGQQLPTLNTAAFKVGSQVGCANLKFELAKTHLIKAGMKMQNKPGHPLGKWTQKQIEDIVDKGIHDGIKKAAVKLSGANTNANTETEASGAKGWVTQVQCGKNGEPRPNLYNAMLALRADPQLVGLFGYDEMRLATILLHHVPGTSAKEAFSPRPATDADVAALQEFLQTAGLETIGKEVVHQAVDLRAMERTFHPVRDYLDNLAWDGKPRLEKWTTTYLGTKDTAYHRAIGRMFLLSLVARIYRPGCQVDYMPVLEGEQGELKSSVCRALVGDDYFSDSLPPIGNDQVRLSQHLRGKWLIEIAEMSAMTRAESEDLKAFITRRVEQYIGKYARKEATEPRRCVFIGSTNKQAYLRDDTGGRRFWPIKIGKISLPALQQDRDQLFAEAVHAYKHGASWWPDRDFERQHIAPLQEARFEADAWEESVADWVEMKHKTTLTEVARGALCIETGRLSRTDQLRIRSALTRLGWKEAPRTKDGRWWVPTKPSAAPKKTDAKPVGVTEATQGTEACL